MPTSNAGTISGNLHHDRNSHCTMQDQNIDQPSHENFYEAIGDVGPSRQENGPGVPDAITGGMCGLLSTCTGVKSASSDADGDVFDKVDVRMEMVSAVSLPAVSDRHVHHYSSTIDNGMRVSKSKACEEFLEYSSPDADMANGQLIYHNPDEIQEEQQIHSPWVTCSIQESEAFNNEAAYVNGMHITGNPRKITSGQSVGNVTTQDTTHSIIENDIVFDGMVEIHHVYFSAL